MHNLLATSVIAGAAFIVSLSGIAAGADSIDLRHSEYTFSNDGPAAGPWSVYRIIYSHAEPGDTFNVEAVNGERSDPAHRQHGAFYRLENFHRFSRLVTTRLSFGAGSGYSPVRSSSGEVVLSPTADPKYTLVVGANLTSANNRSLQRVVAVGSEWHAGVYSATIRYYQTSMTLPNGVGPPTLALGFGASAAHRLQYSVSYNIGGEMSGDRTAAILPTGSGRQGQDASLTVRAPVAALFLSLTGEDSFYVDRMNLRRNQHVFTVSVSRSW